jgi:hypothetical protein
MNRCDYLDPALAWTGVKDTGRGCTLSTIGYETLTRPKSWHLRTHTSCTPSETFMTVTANINFPTFRPPSASAPGASRSLPQLCRDAGIERPLLVTDPGLPAWRWSRPCLPTSRRRG